ncbi:hypothetical protein VNO78_22748 [Psophocarpus tetragonolobus]|uniref:Uncharacterized protein n=1 Tax=Psophocarpus tetragonolobus TaxID=3891 RepID=A0AAN9S247_PSOTE
MATQANGSNYDVDRILSATVEKERSSFGPPVIVPSCCQNGLGIKVHGAACDWSQINDGVNSEKAHSWGGENNTGNMHGIKVGSKGIRCTE